MNKLLNLIKMLKLAIMVSLITTVLSYSIGIVKTPTASEVSKILNG